MKAAENGLLNLWISWFAYSHRIAKEMFYCSKENNETNLNTFQLCWCANYSDLQMYQFYAL